MVPRLVAAGLAPRRITYFNTLLFPPIAAIRVGKRLLRRQRSDPSSDLEMTDDSGRLNGLLRRIFESESSLLARRDLPFGVSLLAIAEAPGRSAGAGAILRSST